MGIKIVSRSIDSESKWTDSVKLSGYFNLSISGTWIGKATIQRSFDKGDTWLNVDTWTANTEEFGMEPEKDVYYRIGVKEGDYTSGTVNLRLSQ